MPDMRTQASRTMNGDVRSQDDGMPCPQAGGSGKGKSREGARILPFRWRRRGCGGQPLAAADSVAPPRAGIQENDDARPPPPCYAALISGVAGMQAVCSLTCAQREGDMQRKLGRKIRGWAFAAWALLAAGPAAAGRRGVRQGDRRLSRPGVRVDLCRSRPGRVERQYLYKPQGAGPFPAVVLAHTCGGLQPHGRAGGSWWRRVLSCCCWIPTVPGGTRRSASRAGAHATGVQGCFRRHAASGLAQGGRSGAHLSGRHVVGQFRRQRRGQSANRQGGRQRAPLPGVGSVRQLRVCAQERAHAATAPPDTDRPYCCCWPGTTRKRPSHPAFPCWTT